MADSLSLYIKKAALMIEPKSISPQYNTVYKITPSGGNYSFTNDIDGASFNITTGVLYLPSGFYNISMTSAIQTTYDFFSMRTYINNDLFLESFGFTCSIGFNTLYESSSDFSVSFTSIWTKPDNSISKPMPIGSYSPSLRIQVFIEKILL